MTYRPLRVGPLGMGLVPVLLWVVALLLLDVNLALGLAMFGIATITAFQFGLRVVHTIEITDSGDLAWRAGYRRGQIRLADMKLGRRRMPRGTVVLLLPAPGRPAFIIGSAQGLAEHLAGVRAAKPDLDLQLDPWIARLRATDQPNAAA